MRSLVLCSALLIASAQSLSAQSVAIAPHLGTLGIGADVSVALTEAVSLRGGANVQPYSPEPEFSDVTFTLNLPTPGLMAVVDLHPGGSGFRISVGAIYFGSDLELDAILNEDVEIGDSIYSPSDLGTLTGTLITRSFSPYLGIGVGNAAGGTAGFFMDAGVAFHGSPEVDLVASGPIANDPEFVTELERERSEIEDEVEGFRVYPVLSLGFRFVVR